MHQPRMASQHRLELSQRNLRDIAQGLEVEVIQQRQDRLGGKRTKRECVNWQGSEKRFFRAGPHIAQLGRGYQGGRNPRDQFAAPHPRHPGESGSLDNLALDPRGGVAGQPEQSGCAGQVEKQVPRLHRLPDRRKATHNLKEHMVGLAGAIMVRGEESQRGANPTGLPNGHARQDSIPLGF